MACATEQPLVSIGVPIYNEAAYIDVALSALRSQDYPEIEIIVCDNASTDDTVEICQRHAQADPRIQVHVAEKNRGITNNFRWASDLASGKYFMWACGHDLWSPELISECVGLLEDNPTACVAYATANWIGPDGESLQKRSGWSDTRGLDPVSRFFTVFWGNMHPVLGLIRVDQFRSCKPIPEIIGGDLVLLADLAIRGEFIHARRSIWFRRELRSEISYQQKLQRYASSDFGVTKSRLGRRFPLLALPWALVRLVSVAPCGFFDKALMLIALLPSLALRYRVGRKNRVS